MFEDSTFESTGRICTRSREWMAATFAFNSSVLLALILIPLWLTQALPRMASAIWMETPQAPQSEPRVIARQPDAVVVQPEMVGTTLFAPSRIPREIPKSGPPEVLSDSPLAQWGLDSSNGPDPFAGTTSKPIVQQKPEAPVRVSSSIIAGLLIRKTVPAYPLIARAARVQGTVVLGAIISKRGTIENLHVVSGP